MPGRTTSSGSYRYGFNGKENDNEVKGEGAQYDYGFRIYDPRLGRFLSVDPLIADYPSWSPYPFAMNRPIDGIDVDGLEWENWWSNFKKVAKGVTALKFNNATETLFGAGRIQHQLYRLEVVNPQKSISQLSKQVVSDIGSVYNTSHGDFSFEKRQNESAISQNDYIKISPNPISAPFFSDIWVKVTGVNDISDKAAGKEGFSLTFRTLEGHVEVGAITFSAYTISNEKGSKFYFEIESTTQVAPELGKQVAENIARSAQYETWEEVLNNVNNFMQGTDAKAKRTAKEYSVGPSGYKVVKDSPTSVAEPNPNVVPQKIIDKDIELKDKK